MKLYVCIYVIGYFPRPVLTSFGNSPPPLPTPRIQIWLQIQIRMRTRTGQSISNYSIAPLF